MRAFFDTHRHSSLWFKFLYECLCQILCEAFQSLAVGLRTALNFFDDTIVVDSLRQIITIGDRIERMEELHGYAQVLRLRSFFLRDADTRPDGDVPEEEGVHGMKVTP